MGLGVVVRQLPVTADGSDWDVFVDQHPEGSFFHLSAWQALLSDVFGHTGHYLYADRDGEIVGVLPLARVRSRLFGDALISTPFCVYGGIVAADTQAGSALEAAACELAESLGVDYLELRDRHPVETDWPTKSGLYVAFERAISADHDANLKAIPRKQRAVVRKGIKAGLEARIEHDDSTLYPVYSESVRNLGTPMFSRRLFPALLAAFGERADVLSVVHQGQALSSVLSFYYKGTVLPYYGGGTAAARAHKAADYMYWALMRHAADRGCRQFDYGRSKVGTGPYSFKKNWGFEPQALHYRYHLVKARSVPNLSPTNPKYQRFIQLWRRLPVPVANRIGPLLSRNLG